MRVLFTLLTLTLCIGACSEQASLSGEEDEQTSTPSSKALPSSTGAKAEVIIVCDDTIWQGSAGGLLRRTLARDQYATRSETYFDLFQLRQRDFREMLSRTRHLIHIEKGTRNSAQVKTDGFARPQNYVHIVYRNGKDLDSLVKRVAAEAFNAFRNLDIAIIQKKWKGRTWPVPKEMASEGINFIFPKSFQTSVEKSNLLVGWAESKNADLVVFVHTRPFTFEDQLRFQKEDLIRWRDSISKAHIPADKEGSYTQTETDPAPEIHLTKVGDLIGFETRGYFRSVGDFMGGSFINITLFDDANSRVIMMDGLVYAPNQKKRSILMELEAMFRSLTLK